MKKTFILFIVSFLLILSGCSWKPSASPAGQDEPRQEADMSQEEKDFNASGQAKAILDETDMWMYHVEEGPNFGIKYPHDVDLNERGANDLLLTVESKKVGELDGTMGFNKETALKNMASLANKEYGEPVDWPVPGSKRVASRGSLNAQNFMVAGRFDICDVAFEDKLYFFKDNYQIVITLIGDKDAIMESMPEYFEADAENCSGKKRWSENKQSEFYQAVMDGTASEEAKYWNDLFYKIIATIEFYNTPDPEGGSLTNGDYLPAE